MTFDPDRPDAHAESRETKTSRAPASDAESRAIERLAVVSLDGTLKGWDAGFASSAVAQFDRSQRLTDAQWKQVVRIARMAPPVKRAPTPAHSPLDAECSDVEAQLDELLRLPLGQGGERCLLTVQEALGRADRVARVLGVQGDDDRALERIHGAFGLCGTCTIGPARACPRCAAGTPHPGEPCADPRRNRYCRGWSLLASLYAKRLGGERGAEIRADIGLDPVETKP